MLSGAHVAAPMCLWGLDALRSLRFVRGGLHTCGCYLSCPICGCIPVRSVTRGCSEPPLAGRTVRWPTVLDRRLSNAKIWSLSAKGDSVSYPSDLRWPRHRRDGRWEPAGEALCHAVCFTNGCASYSGRKPSEAAPFT